jgi:hypothetical protein
MNFRIADTFTDSLAKLTGEEQKADGIQRSDDRSQKAAADPGNRGSHPFGLPFCTNGLYSIPRLSAYIQLSDGHLSVKEIDKIF